MAANHLNLVEPNLRVHTGANKKKACEPQL
jgi:hypothetical protein